MAKRWLQRNLKNRSFRSSHVRYLRNVILSRLWQEDLPTPICFNEQGRLRDGQHRLMAIVEAGVPCVLHVHTGVPDEAFAHIDCGMMRQLRDRITFHEDPKVNRLACQIVTSWRMLDLEVDISGDHRSKINPHVAETIWKRHEEAITAIVSIAKSHQTGVSRVPVLCALCEMYERSPVKAVGFANTLFQPDGTCQQARILRDWLLRNSAKIGGGYTASCQVYQRAVGAMKAALGERTITKIYKSSSW